jgi:hypothetical protein
MDPLAKTNAAVDRECRSRPRVAPLLCALGLIGGSPLQLPIFRRILGLPRFDGQG